MLGTKEFLSARNANLFNFVDLFAATVVTLAGITLGIFIRERRTQRC